MAQDRRFLNTNTVHACYGITGLRAPCPLAPAPRSKYQFQGSKIHQILGFQFPLSHNLILEPETLELTHLLPCYLTEMPTLSQGSGVHWITSSQSSQGPQFPGSQASKFPRSKESQFRVPSPSVQCLVSRLQCFKAHPSAHLQPSIVLAFYFYYYSTCYLLLQSTPARI